MNEYVRLLKKGCFRREDVAAMSGNVNTADTVIQAYKKRGLIVSVRRNLYAAISLETNMPVCNVYEIASSVSDDSYVSHHSAFEYYGMANQVFVELYVSSKARFTDFEFDGRHYVRVESKTDKGIDVHGKVRVTDLERTIIDNIKDFSKIGGLEELLHCLSMVTYVDENKLMTYLEIYENQFLWQKTGYILSLFPGMKLSQHFFEVCKSHCKKSIRYLYEEVKYENPVFAKDWGLYVPKDMMKLLDEGGEALV